ncbi:MAG: FG-GAP repeat protein, partial [Xanthomonadales bacterium]|nr:FG-GAP repeat protein [Xanthomonadales bacterium]
ASRADANGYRSGRTYVIYGRLQSDPFPAILPLGDLDASRGFVINGAATYDQSGRVTAAIGDVNGDGLDDLAVGASGTDFYGSASGSTYVLFGNASVAFSGVVELSELDGSNGFRIDGAEAFANSGVAVTRAGDFNADGIDDVVIGAVNANRSDLNPFGTGSAFVLLGRPPSLPFPASLSLSAVKPAKALRLDGELDQSSAGFVVDGGTDINGDGYDDVVIGAYRTDFNGTASGSAYVVFGGPDVIPPDRRLDLSDLDGSNGFRIDGTAEGDEAARSVSFPGDFNGDGRADLLVPAERADIAGPSSGSSYLIYGRPLDRPYSPQMTLGSLASTEALRIDGREIDYAGVSVSAAGDMNGDGLQDLLVGTLGGGEGGGVYVVFGDDRMLKDGFE